MASFLGLRRNNQVSSMEEGNHQHELCSNLELFHSRLADLVLPSLPEPEEPLLSLPFLRKLLHALLLSLQEFHSLLLPLLPPRSPLLSHLSRRLLASLDALDSASRSLHALRSSLALALLASSSFPSHPLRSRSALARLLPSLSPPSSSSPRAWSFGRSSRRHGEGRNDDSPHRSLSLQALTLGLRGGDDPAACALSSLVALVMWCLTAALPHGDGGEEAPRLPAVPRQFPWAAVAERLREGCRRRGGAAGMLRELQRMERCGRAMAEEDGAAAMAAAEELAEVCREVEEELAPLQRQVREVFHRMAWSRVEVMEALNGSPSASSL